MHLPMETSPMGIQETDNLGARTILNLTTKPNTPSIAGRFSKDGEVTAGDASKTIGSNDAVIAPWGNFI